MLDGETSSVAALYTQHYVTLDNGPQTPVGLLIPTRAGTDGLTLLYYSSTPAGYGGGFRIFIDTSAGIAAALHAYGLEGNWQREGYFVDGVQFGGGPFTVYQDRAPGTWSLTGLRTAPALTTFPAGGLSLNMYAGNTQRGYGIPNLRLARILVYYRRLTNAEFAGLLPPSDYEQEYTFATYQPGDLTVTDTVSGQDATLYY